MGSPFASQTSATIPLPFDPPHTVTVRRLTGRETDAAQAAHRDTLADASPRSWAATFRRALTKGATDPQVLQAIADPLTGYDRFSVVRAGLVGWSYPQSIKPLTPSQVADGQTTNAVDDLDDEAVDFIATEILRLTKPALFHATEEDAEAAQKKD
jgi:hypothetical protein